jgi:hypothetical protein
VTSHYVPLPPFGSAAEWDAYMADIAPYMSRLLAVLKHTTMNLAILTTDRGDQLRRTLEEVTVTSQCHHCIMSSLFFYFRSAYCSGRPSFSFDYSKQW